MVARALHQASQRADKPLVVINCATLQETLLESEFFGHEKGAFTGAISTKQGLFEVADGGTLLIDEIGEMPGSLQAKLLRVLEDGSMRRVSSLQERRVNVRLLSSTNRNMAEEVKAGRFREDLYYRINVMSLTIPPLRQRVGDIPQLVAHLVGDEWTVEPEALEAMTAYPWPGNVRQLINALDRAKILADDRFISLDDLPPEVARGGDRNGQAQTSPSSDALASIQRTHILEVLKREKGSMPESVGELARVSESAVDFVRHDSGVRRVLKRAALAVDPVRTAVRHRRALDLAISCRVASQQSPTPFRQAPNSISSLRREPTSTRLRDVRLWIVLQNVVHSESHSRATENYPQLRRAAQVVRLPRSPLG